MDLEFRIFTPDSQGVAWILDSGFSMFIPGALRRILDLGFSFLPLPWLGVRSWILDLGFWRFALCCEPNWILDFGFAPTGGPRLWILDFGSWMLPALTSPWTLDLNSGFWTLGFTFVRAWLQLAIWILDLSSILTSLDLD